MKHAIAFLLVAIAFTCQAQVNVTGKSYRIMNSDSTHGELNATEYVTSAGYYRYKENGVWYYRASTADIAAAATLAANGLTKTLNTIRLGGNITTNTTIGDNGGGQFLSFGLIGTRLGRIDGFGQNVNFDGSVSSNFQVGSQSLTLNTTSAQLTGTTVNVSSSSSMNLSSSGGALNLSTNAVSRLQIDNDGSWTINSTPGTSGQALVSNGASSTPTWQTVGTTETASNGLTKVVNDIRLGGALTGNTSITGAFSLTLEPQNLNINATNAVSGNASSFSFTSIGGDITFNAGDDISFLGDAFVTSTTSASINATTSVNLGSGTDINLSADGDVKLVQVPTNNNALTQIIGRNSLTGAVEYRDASSITPTLTSTQVGYGSGSNTLTGEAAFTYDDTSNTLQVDNILSQSGTTLSLTGLVNIDIQAIGDVLLQPNDDIILNPGDDILLSDALINNNALTSLMGRNSSTGAIEERTVASITGVPAGSTTQVQFNNAGAFGADADLTFTGGNLLTATNVTVTTALINSALTATRIPVIGASGLFTDDADLVYDATNNIITLATDVILNGTADAIIISGSGGNTSYSLSGMTRQTGTGNIGISTSVGNINIEPRIGGGTGFVVMTGLPTTCSGAPTGAIANISGVLNICP